MDHTQTDLYTVLMRYKAEMLERANGQFDDSTRSQTWKRHWQQEHNAAERAISALEGE